MKIHWLWLTAVLILLAGQAYGETVHLSSGEAIEGQIVSADEDIISIESEKGFGVLQIRKADIILIEYTQAKRNPDNTIGIGYQHRVNPDTSGSGAVTYGVDALSLKFWMSSDSSLDFLLGFFSSENAGTTDFEVFSFDVRLATVFKRQAQLDLYWGGSAGFISVKDNTAATPVDDSGETLSVFVGAEVFFVTFPNLGISGEVGFFTQSVGDRTTTNISTATFPSFSVRYYF